MDVFEAVRTLLAVRQYQEKPVPDEVVRRIVEAGHLTASSMNQQPWHFVVVRDRERLRQLGGLVKTGPYIADAQLAIAVAYEKASQFGVSDASRAVQSMILTAWADGVGSNWAGGPDILGDLKPLLGIPDDLDVVAVLPFGYPAQPAGGGKKKRKPLREIAHRERFGTPFE
jgi:nitroreductase